MGRKRENYVYEFFEYDERTCTSRCLEENCTTVLKGNHGANLLRHFRLRHTEQFLIIQQNNEEKKSQNKSATKDQLTKNLMNLATNQGRSFTLLDDEAFLDIINLIPLPDPASENAHRIKELKEKMKVHGSQAAAQPQPPVLPAPAPLRLQPRPSSAYAPVSLGGAEDTGSSDSNLPFQAGLQDPRSKTLNQCRICGEFSEECIDMTNEETPYLERNRIKITLNDMSVDLDLNIDALPKTVCLPCDVKLNEVFDFVKLVKSAQDALVVRVDDDMRQAYPDMRETETVVIKTECDSPTPDDNETKDGIVDAVTIGETVFVKSNVAQKRKSDETHNKKAKVTKRVDKNKENSELIIDIKEVIEMDDGHEAERLGIGDTGPDVKPSQLELVMHGLHNEMPSNQTFRETATSDGRK